MDWLNAVSDIVQRYSGQGGGAASAPADVHSDYQQVSKAAPAEVTSSGISEAFRSDQTPPFPRWQTSSADPTPTNELDC